MDASCIFKNKSADKFVICEQYTLIFVVWYT